MEELINYKSFIDFLSENNLFNENLPTKTIYKRLQHIAIRMKQCIYKYDIAILNTAISNAIFDIINKPFLNDISLVAKLDKENDRIKFKIGIPPKSKLFNPIFPPTLVGTHR